jgi:flavin-dependent dehydrogenase
MHSQSFDVIVLGGGPAATAAALTLRHYSSLSVAVIEKSNYDTPRIGETLSPGVQGLLSYLKVWDDFVADGHQPSLGTSAAWGSSDVQMQDFIFTPFGKGWHLDRQRFDLMLAGAVTKAGGTVWRNARIVDCFRTPANQWQLTIERAGETTEVRARFLIDATGKAGSLVKREGVKRWMMDRLVAIVGTLRFPHDGPQDTFTLVETCKEGWWYSARLPNASMIVAFMSDADIVQKQNLHAAEAWLKALAQTQHTQERLRDGQLIGGLRTFAAYSSCLEKMFGEGWVAVGDTAASHDPLSSSGIPRALDSGIHAARAIHDFLRHERPSALKSYEAALKQSFETYIETRAQYYKMETRWPDAPFWRRRQQDITLNPHGLLHSRLHSGIAAPTKDSRTNQLQDTPAIDQVWETLASDLTPYEYRLLCELCARPRPAHEVVTAFHQASGRPVPDQRVILALQNLLEQGVVAVV